MNLDGASISHRNVTETQLREAFRCPGAYGEFIILKRDGQHYMQAAGEGDDDEPCILEYREGDNEHHFCAAGEYTKAQVEQAFVWYLNNDNRWRTEYPWEKQEIKPWWKFW